MRPACRPALDPGDLCDPSGQGLRAGQGLPRRTARHTEHHLQPRSRELNYKIEVSTVPGDGHSPPAPPGESGSPTNCAACSSTTPPPAGSPCTTPAEPSASPARPCCRRSSAANWTPSSPAPDAGKAYASTFPTPPTPYSDHDNQRKEQCDHASNAARRSASNTHSRLASLPQAVLKMASIAS